MNALPQQLSEVFKEATTLRIREAENEVEKKQAKYARKFNPEFIAILTELKERAPTVSDLVQDNVEYLVLKISTRKTKRFASARIRLKHLAWLLNHCSQKFPGVEIYCENFERIGLAARVGKDTHFETEPKPLPSEDDHPTGYDQAVMHMPLSHVLETYYVPQRLLGKSKNTERLYSISIRKFSRFLGRTAVVGDLNTKAVTQYLHFQLHQTALSRATIEKERVQILTIWRFCARKRWLTTFPEIPSIPVPERVPDAWTQDDMVALLGGCKILTGMVGNVAEPVYFEALIRAIFDCGERISAILSARWDDLDTQGWLLIRGEHRKRKTRDKRFKLRPETLEMLLEMRRLNRTWNEEIFHWPLDQSMLWARYKKILVAAGLPTGRRNLFHKLRRTVASEFEAAGGNATELLDHQYRKTTLRYLDPRVLKQVQPADIVPGIGKKIEQAINTGDDSELIESIRKLVAEERSRKLGA